MRTLLLRLRAAAAHSRAARAARARAFARACTGINNGYLLGVSGVMAYQWQRNENMKMAMKIMA